jgi:hypothetical protein
MLLISKRSLIIILSLLTIFTILSLHISTVNLQSKFFESASAQGFNNTRSGIQNETAGSTIPADRSLIVNLLADSLENRLNKSGAILEITGELPQVKIYLMLVQLVLSYMEYQKILILQKEK